MEAFLKKKSVKLGDKSFKIKKKIGDGGFGVVVEVKDEKSKETYALKYQILDPEKLERFKEEIEIYVRPK